MSLFKKEDIGGNNFLISIGLLFIVLAILLFINKEIKMYDLSFEATIRGLNVQIEDIWMLICSVFLGCGFLILGFRKT